MSGVANSMAVVNSNEHSLLHPAVITTTTLFCLFLVVGKRAMLGLVTAVACLGAVQLGDNLAAHACSLIAIMALLFDIIQPVGLKVTDVTHPRTDNVLSAVRRAPKFTPPITHTSKDSEVKSSSAAPPTVAKPSHTASPNSISPTQHTPTPAAASGAGAVSPAESTEPSPPCHPDLHADDAVELPMSLPRAASGSSDKHSFVALPNIVNKVRGVDYMADGVKVQPEPPLFECVNVDCFYCDSKTPGLLSNPTNYYPKARAAGDTRFYFIVHYATPPKPLMHMVMYFAVDPDRLDSCPEFARLWRKFLNGDDAWRNERLKIVPNVAEAPWAVRWAVGGSKPVLLARRLKHTYTINEQDKVVLVDCDVESSSWASGIVGTLRGNISHVVIDLGFTLEGRASNELPERIMGAGQLRYINLKKCGSLDK